MDVLQVDTESNLLAIQDDTCSLTSLLPDDLRGPLQHSTSNVAQLQDIVLDLGRRPYAYYGPRDRRYLHEDIKRVVTASDIITVEDVPESSDDEIITGHAVSVTMKRLLSNEKKRREEFSSKGLAVGSPPCAREC